MENNEISQKIKTEIINGFKKEFKKMPFFQKKITEKIIKTIGKMNISVECECDIISAEIKTDYFSKKIYKKIKELNMEVDYFPDKETFNIEINSNELL